MECLTLASPPPPPPPPRSDQLPSPTSSTANSSTASTPPFPPTNAAPQRRPSLILQESPPPSTFVHADPSSFKNVVQRLTGLTQEPSARKPVASSANHPSQYRPLLSTIKKSASFKLFERRREKNLRNLKLSDPEFSFLAGVANASSPVPLSPSAVLDLTQLSLSSPRTPSFNSDPIAAAAAEEERAIAEKGFYLHPSTPRGSGESSGPPRLLPLFPVSSPRASSLPPSS